jgi:hypothetical protein
MGSLPRTAPRLIAATIVLLGCAAGPGNAPARSVSAAASPSPWVSASYVVADTTAPTADTLYATGACPRGEGAPALAIDCTTLWTPTQAEPPTIVSLTVPLGIDLRELLDGAPLPAGGHRPDVVVTTDADVVAYATGRADYLVAALPWSVTYVLVPERATQVISFPTRAERDAIARDAVTADARGAAEPFPWLTDTACADIGTFPMTARRPVVGYSAGDATARQLAERIVSLAGVKGGLPWATVAVGGDTSARGGDTADVLPVERDPRTVCTTAGNARVPAGAVPLVDTRAHVIVRRGSGAAFMVAADGSLFFFRQGAR